MRITQTGVFLFSKCGGGNCWWSAEEGNGFGSLIKGGEALVQDLALKRLEGSSSQCFLSG
jgi:hypothetical protein